MPRISIRNNDGSSVLYLEIDSGKLSEPSPELPNRNYTVYGDSARTIPGWDGSDITVGRTLRFVAGTDESSGEIVINVSHLDEDEVADLRSKSFAAAPVLYSDGTDFWRCVFRPGDGLKIDSHNGFPGRFRGEITLDILEKVT